MITESKKIRTRTGSTMMFATLDDLDGAVELLVFEKALDAAEDALQPDQIVIVRGRVDHKEAGKVCVMVAGRRRGSTRPRPRSRRPRDRRPRSPPPARRRRCACASTPARLPASVIEELKRALRATIPGESEVVLEMHTRTGLRRLRFGTEFRVAGRNAALKAELDRVLGAAVLPVASAAA